MAISQPGVARHRRLQNSRLLARQPHGHWRGLHLTRFRRGGKWRKRLWRRAIGIRRAHHYTPPISSGRSLLATAEAAAMQASTAAKNAEAAARRERGRWPPETPCTPSIPKIEPRRLAAGLGAGGNAEETASDAGGEADANFGFIESLPFVPAGSLDIGKFLELTLSSGLRPARPLGRQAQSL